MKLLLERVQLDPAVTIGRLSVDGVPECWTCEDTVREVEGQPVEAWKVKTATAIPRGTYRVIITMSARFGVMLPLLVDVPGFTGIRIHPGNTALDTDGCILPGVVRLPAGVGKSRIAFDALMHKIRAADTVAIEVR